ncbi:membrane-bound lytic murein transglycosylase MltF [Nitrogeniibacter mangrovi]|uniref:Membrane-bound lytic murein transglycosylase MltF n=1 Tax=Nitrogeniibacter mangrovi TaxID=2016596 RepID=A0A6C1B1J7_9RHOO|nr:membrane-bound lytic murein transglycosylase MltF [Nitrogeniibacter mangrovi]QID17233.1 membrane-bound lytic murein transglycosylase MltF [Nitrogeniibacter mangrovi]
MRLLASLALVLLLTGCPRGEAPVILDYQTLGELRVATRVDTVAYRQTAEGETGGFEHDLLVELGNELRIPVRFIVYRSTAQVLNAVRRGDAHLGAAGLGLNRQRRGLIWSPPVRQMHLVIAATEPLASTIKRAEDLAGHTVTVRRNTLAAEQMKAFQADVPGIRLERVSGRRDGQLLGDLADGKIELLVTDAVHLSAAAVLRPELKSVLPLPNDARMAWVMPPTASPKLVDTVSHFLERAHAEGLIERLEDRYFGYIERLDQTDIAAFVERMQTRLPRFIPMFKWAADRTGVDWRLLAAIAYQESQWDPLAVSFTGVRGLMMLTDDTASRMGVHDRLDPAQSILGGARYYALMRESIDAAVPEPDRSWMAVAAYNLGLGHLRGARQIARSLGRDNTAWIAMRGVLPLLSRPSFARRLKAGPARGGEAVIMTENVRAFYDILQRLDSPMGDEALPLPAPIETRAAAIDQAVGSSTSTPPM